MNGLSQEFRLRYLLQAHLPEIRQRIEERLGLHFGPTRQMDLTRGVLAAATSSSDPEQWLEELCRGVWTPSHADLLSIHLTVGETYFFRDPEVFAALARRLIPEILRRKEAIGQRQLRVWCAGCSSGEEPYSVAMVLEEVLPTGWHAHILATDINPAALEQARKGTYADWSFRGNEGGCRERFFKREPHHRWRLKTAIRRRVCFASLNLVDPVYPSPINGTDQIDLILCRNVLMYLSHALAVEVVQRFRKALNPWGRLMVSPAEASPRLLRGLSLEMVEGALCYRRAEEYRDLLEAPGLPWLEAPPDPLLKTVDQDCLPFSCNGIVTTPSRPSSARAGRKNRRAKPGVPPLAEPFRLCDPALREDATGVALFHLRTALIASSHRLSDPLKRRIPAPAPEVVPAQIPSRHATWNPAKSRTRANRFIRPLEFLSLRKDNETPHSSPRYATGPRMQADHDSQSSSLS